MTKQWRIERLSISDARIESQNRVKMSTNRLAESDRETVSKWHERYSSYYSTVNLLLGELVRNSPHKWFQLFGSRINPNGYNMCVQQWGATRIPWRHSTYNTQCKAVDEAASYGVGLTSTSTRLQCPVEWQLVILAILILTCHSRILT
jgi:hypothetical protein